MRSVLPYTPTTIEKFVQRDLSGGERDAGSHHPFTYAGSPFVRESDAQETVRGSLRSQSPRAWLAVFASVGFFVAGVVLGYFGRDYETLSLVPEATAFAHERTVLRIDYELQHR